MTTTLAPPSTDLTPVQRAVVAETIDLFEPEVFLEYRFPELDVIRLYHAWTVGGAPLGDKADDAALARGLDFADYVDLTSPHLEEVEHGRVKIVTFGVRPILAAILAGQREARGLRERLVAAPWFGFSAGPWLGVGPRLVTRK